MHTRSPGHDKLDQENLVWVGIDGWKEVALVQKHHLSGKLNGWRCVCAAHHHTLCWTMQRWSEPSCSSVAASVAASASTAATVSDAVSTTAACSSSARTTGMLSTATRATAAHSTRRCIFAVNKNDVALGFDWLEQTARNTYTDTHQAAQCRNAPMSACRTYMASKALLATAVAVVAVLIVLSIPHTRQTQPKKPKPHTPAPAPAPAPAPQATQSQRGPYVYY
jgi:hypothetical protein